MRVNVELVTTPVSVENLIQGKRKPNSVLPLLVPPKQKVFDTWTTLFFKDKAPVDDFRKQAELANQQGLMFQVGSRDACP